MGMVHHLRKYQILLIMDNLTLLTYTNSKCWDVHSIYLKSLIKYFSELKHHYILSDIPINKDTIIYNNSSYYYEQMLLGLSNVKTEFVIYSQEDYILYDYVNITKIQNYIDKMQKNKDISFIRLIPSGLAGNEIPYEEDLVVVNPNSYYYFSTQASIWRCNFLRSMFEKSKIDSIFEEPKNSPFLASLKSTGLCSTLNRGNLGEHYYADVYPYIATALVKGQWNFKEYRKYLEPILQENNIDCHQRGVF